MPRRTRDFAGRIGRSLTRGHPFLIFLRNVALSESKSCGPTSNGLIFEKNRCLLLLVCIISEFLPYASIEHAVSIRHSGQNPQHFHFFHQKSAYPGRKSGYRVTARQHFLIFFQKSAHALALYRPHFPHHRKQDQNKNKTRILCKPCFSTFWWSVTGSNRRHSGCDPDALPAELTDLILFCIFIYKNQYTTLPSSKQ